MKPLPNHPFVFYDVQPAWQGAKIRTFCRYCRDQWSHRCTQPRKLNAWLYRYGALHAHGSEPLKQQFFRQYDAELHGLHRR
jgi:hypothetical protein